MQLSVLMFFAFAMVFCTKTKNDNNVSDTAQVWITNPSRTALLWQTTTPLLNSVDENISTIKINPAQQYQTIDGFGYTLTGGSALLINQLDKDKKTALLKELFDNTGNGIGVSYLRISLGASDLSESVFTYNDLPKGETDENIERFSLSRDTLHLIPILKEILLINPKLKLLASPWTAPAWMKNNENSVGGYLKNQYYGSYAKYFVKYISAMQKQNINIDAITLQNEPEHGGNNPSMLMTSAHQADFVKNHLGPAFEQANIKTKIIIWDHNCDNPNYPITVLNDATAKKYIDGAAFHLYAGDVSALSQVHSTHPDKNVYFTEQWTGANGDFAGDLKWHTKHVIIGTMKNWSKVALEWNLANDPSYLPHTPGGCTQCKGALTIDNKGVITKNVSYYIIAQASKFVPAGSVVIGSSEVNNIANVAFKTPEQKIVVIALNETTTEQKVNIIHDEQKISYTMSPGAVATYIF